MQIIETYIQIYEKYLYNNYLFVFLAIVGALTIFHEIKNRRTKKIVFLSILFAILIAYNAIIFVIMEKVGEGSSYYRLLWGIPVVLFASYIIFLWTQVIRSVFLKVGILLMGIILLFFTYEVPSFSIPNNIKDLNVNVIEIADAIERDREYEFVRLVGDSDVMYGLREYNANIILPFGSSFFYGDDVEKPQLYNTIQKGLEVEDILVFEDWLSIYKIDYIAVKKDYISVNSALEQLDKKLIFENKKYNLYRNESIVNDSYEIRETQTVTWSTIKTLWSYSSSFVLIGMGVILWMYYKKMTKIEGDN